MLSIITPTNNTRYLEEAYDSLAGQTYKKWEWIVVPNGGATWESKDKRVRVIPADFTGSIGGLKRFACRQARGDILVELDHDDLLTPTALGQIVTAFEDAEVGMVYSNFADFNAKDWSPHVFSPLYGWRYQDREFFGHKAMEALTFPPNALSMTAIEFAPNHVRAWRAKTYWDLGGHDASLSLADDYDLCCRMYLQSTIKHIPDCLYLYRVHDAQVWQARNAELVAASIARSDLYREPIVKRWAELEGLHLLDLGARLGKPWGYTGVDIMGEPSQGVDVLADLRDGIPFPDSSVGVVRAYDFLEHLPDKERTMNEIYRVLAPGGWLLSLTPSSDGRGAFQDPTHVSYWNENSFWYYTNRNYAAYAPRIKCRFQARRVKTFFPTEFHRTHLIPYVQADLVALKDGMGRVPGAVEI